MNKLYEVAGISKQALHQFRKRHLQKATEANKFFDQANKIREDHPGAGCRKIAWTLRIKGWGRDKIESLLLGNGYRLFYPPNYKRTTYSQTAVYDPNLIEGLELSGINQLIQTDITYFKAGNRFYYIVFIIDVYSRTIVGYAASKTLEAEGNIRALMKMFQFRRGKSLKGMIHHSDRGGQYIDKEYRQLLTDRGVKLSMCKAAWENAYTERINRTIKDEYLNRWKIDNYESLVKHLDLAVTHYNKARPHNSLNKETPLSFEKKVHNLPYDQKPKFLIYKHKADYQQSECEY